LEVAVSIKYLTTEEVAERFRTTPNTVHYWRATGTGPVGVRIARRVLYAETDVERFEAEAREREQSAAGVA